MQGLENLKKIANELDQKIDIYNDQFGPNDEHVLKLKKELSKVNELILNLMVLEQEMQRFEAFIK